LTRKFFISSTKDNHAAFFNMHCLNKSLNSIGPTYREQVAYWFNLDKCTLLSRQHVTSLPTACPILSGTGSYLILKPERFTSTCYAMFRQTTDKGD